MKNLKKLLAIVVCIAMMVPTVAFAATSSPAKVDVKSATAKSLTYNAKSQTTTIVVNGKTLTLNKDFKVVSGSLKATKAGTYTVKIKGIGNYSGDTTVKYTVNAQQSYKATAAAKTYNAKNQTTKVTVKYGNTVLKRGTDYKITGVTKAKNAGKYKITVKGINNYKGTKTIYYTINKAAQKSVKVSVNASKKKVTVSGVKAKAKVTYKSGNKKFDLAALYYGLQLQLVVYMNAAMELEGRKHPDKEIVPAALLYYHIDDPTIETPVELSDEQINEQILTKLRMNGVVNSDPEVVERLDRYLQDKSVVIPVEKKKDGSFSARSGILSREEMQLVSAYVDAKIRDIGREILDGKIAANPYEKGNEEACTYCAYKKVCGFDGSIPGYEKRQLEDLDKQTLMQRMQETTEA